MQIVALLSPEGTLVTEIDYTLPENQYLTLTVERISDMLKLSTGKQVADFLDGNKNPPYWFIYQKKFALKSIAEGLSEQTWTFGLVYVVASATAGYDGKYERQMRIDLPAAVNYINAKPALTYTGSGAITSKTQAVKFFNGGSQPPIRTVGIFGLAANERYLGYELDCTCTYRIQV